jgi:adenylate cyclase
VLFGLWGFYEVKGALQTARELAEQLLTVATGQKDPALILQGYRALGDTLFWLGEFTAARTHLEQGIALYDPTQHRTHVFIYGQDPGMGCRAYAAHTLWILGYPDQALHLSQEAITVGQALSHPFSLVFALSFSARLHHFRQEWHVVQERAEAVMALAVEQGFTQFLAAGTYHRSFAFVKQGQFEEGMTYFRQSLAATRATGTEYNRSIWLASLAEAYRLGGQLEEGLLVIDEAMAAGQKTGERAYEAERYRLKGELLLQQSSHNQAAAETCFLQALNVARLQHAKSWELRTAMSLARLWQRQGKRAEACDLLAPIYDWFTEGFDTADLQEAKALLDALS